MKLDDLPELQKSDNDEQFANYMFLVRWGRMLYSSWWAAATIVIAFILFMLICELMQP